MVGQPAPKEGLRRWAVVAALASAQFIMVLDSTVMNVSILLTSLTAAFDSNVSRSPDLPASIRSGIAAQTSGGLEFVSATDAEAAMSERGLSRGRVEALGADYPEAEVTALKTALGGVAVVAAFGLLVTRRLPAEPLATADGAAAVSVA